MLQTYLTGKDAIECFESITTADIRGLDEGNGTLTVFTNENGGILDDLIVNRVNSEFLYVVSNAARKEHDSQLIQQTVDYFREKKGKSVAVRFFDPSERALLALQGPAAAASLQPLTKIDLSQLYFMTTSAAEIAGVKDCRVTRCGYTGEDGFEISIPAKQGAFIAEALLETNAKTANVKLAGLGARDSLRLEAGMCLYGSDIDTTTTPVEAALAWLVGKRRRDEKNFPGANVVVDQLKKGVSRRRVGVRMLVGPPARHGVEIYVNGEAIGEITSGCPSPSLNGNVAMGYVKEEFKKSGTAVELKIRDKFFSAEISKMPFTKSNYYQKPKQ
jgi:aminomethyltransferase